MGDKTKQDRRGKSPSGVSRRAGGGVSMENDGLYGSPPTRATDSPAKEKEGAKKGPVPKSEIGSDANGEVPLAKTKWDPICVGENDIGHGG